LRKKTFMVAIPRGVRRDRPLAGTRDQAQSRGKIVHVPSTIQVGAMNTLAAMRTFRRVAELGGFAAAARDLDLSNAAVSKHVRELERSLGVVLFARTTRRMSLTEAGALYLAHCIRILDQIALAEEELGELQRRPRGRLRVNAPMSFGIVHVAPAIAAFASRYPEIHIELDLDDRIVDLVAGGFDLGLRIRESLPDSSLAARRLCAIDRVLIASPDYLRAHGVPASIEDLRQHRLLAYSLSQEPDRWLFRTEGGDRVAVGIQPWVRANSSLALREMVLRGAGITYMPRFVVAADLASGALTQVLAHNPSPEFALHAVLPAGRKASPKVRALVDHLVESFAAARM
jgi:DNA-binding transcriptional LysR family regulator